ncbi:Transposable element Tc3 transposase [Porphyridium purpureum]|uniref:Transposable element Tc3 transposase n=1 Tax=Porphyridium purpureum TaxID=35688 RepID=A0A5J4YI85_PORPP|nr:Transposable element Tc3 transposase [Porphyridium purpureum]|eukprot:POR9508..scf270_19
MRFKEHRRDRKAGDARVLEAVLGVAQLAQSKHQDGAAHQDAASSSIGADLGVAKVVAFATHALTEAGRFAFTKEMQTLIGSGALPFHKAFGKSEAARVKHSRVDNLKSIMAVKDHEMPPEHRVLKCRVVAQGCHITDADGRRAPPETLQFDRTPGLSSIRAAVSVTLHVHSAAADAMFFDIDAAYVHAPLKGNPTFAHFKAMLPFLDGVLPRNDMRKIATLKDPVVPLPVALYGLPRAGFDFSAHAREKLTGARWQESASDRNVYWRHRAGVLTLLVPYCGSIAAREELHFDSTGRNIGLTGEENGRIHGLRESSNSVRAISTKIGRSKNVVFRYLSAPNDYCQKYANVNASKLAEAVKTKIFNIAKLPNIHTARQVQAALRICGAKPIQNLTTIIKAVSDTYAYRKIPACPPLTLNRKLKRLAWARYHQLEQTNWTAIVFTGEKKFNLDGPDGFHKTEKIHFHFIEGSFTAAKYFSLLREDNVLDRCRQIAGPNMGFQQNNAPVHTSRLVKNFMNDENVELLDWPAYLPEFNIIENLWGILARKVYEGARQYQTVLELKNAILLAWETLDQPVLANLYASVLFRKGGCKWMIYQNTFVLMTTAILEPDVEICGAYVLEQRVDDTVPNSRDHMHRAVRLAFAENPVVKPKPHITMIT